MVRVPASVRCRAGGAVASAAPPGRGSGKLFQANSAAWGLRSLQAAVLSGPATGGEGTSAGRGREGHPRRGERGVRAAPPPSRPHARVPQSPLSPARSPQPPQAPRRLGTQPPPRSSPRSPPRSRDRYPAPLRASPAPRRQCLLAGPARPDGARAHPGRR